MAAEFVTVTWTELDVGGAGLYGSVRAALSGRVVIGSTTYEPKPLSFPVINSAGQTVPLLANDSPGAAPPNSFYTFTITITGQPSRSFAAFVNFANGASQTLSSLELQNLQPAAGYAAFMPLSGGQFTGAVAGNVVTVTDGPSPTLNAGLAGHFRWTLGANRVVPLPSGGFDGQLVLLDLIQDGTGGRTVTWAGGYDFGAASVPVLSTAPGAEDTVGLQRNAPAGGWKVLAFGPGYRST